MRRALMLSAAASFAALSAILLAMATASPAYALDKVDPYICPTKAQSSGMECFLEAIPQTYTMCRHIKSIEIVEFGLAGAQEGVHGAKTDGCIDKHKLSVNLPYQAALHAARNPTEVQSVRKLYATWLDSLGKLRPVPPETDEQYKERVVLPYAEFNAQIKVIRDLLNAPPPSDSKRPPKKAPSKS